MFIRGLNGRLEENAPMMRWRPRLIERAFEFNRFDDQIRIVRVVDKLRPLLSIFVFERLLMQGAKFVVSIDDDDCQSRKLALTSNGEGKVLDSSAKIECLETFPRDINFGERLDIVQGVGAIPDGHPHPRNRTTDLG